MANPATVATAPNAVTLGPVVVVAALGCELRARSEATTGAVALLAGRTKLKAMAGDQRRKQLEGSGEQQTAQQVVGIVTSDIGLSWLIVLFKLEPALLANQQHGCSVFWQGRS